ncbi:hypothetical protein G3V96_27645, partial [Escherichia coli]|nr:hypothetical protein [Escherichia coli]
MKKEPIAKVIEKAMRLAVHLTPAARLCAKRIEELGKRIENACLACKLTEGTSDYPQARENRTKLRSKRNKERKFLLDEIEDIKKKNYDLYAKAVK